MKHCCIIFILNSFRSDSNFLTGWLSSSFGNETTLQVYGCIPCMNQPGLRRVYQFCCQFFWIRGQLAGRYGLGKSNAPSNPFPKCGFASYFSIAFSCLLQSSCKQPLLNRKWPFVLFVYVCMADQINFLFSLFAGAWFWWTSALLISLSTWVFAGIPVQSAALL